MSETEWTPGMLRDELVRLAHIDKMSAAVDANNRRFECDALRSLLAEARSVVEIARDGEELFGSGIVAANALLARIDAALAEGAEKRLPLSVCASCGHTWTEDTVWCARCAERI